jgi:hypothetical protein
MVFCQVKYYKEIFVLKAKIVLNKMRRFIPLTLIFIFVFFSGCNKKPEPTCSNNGVDIVSYSVNPVGTLSPGDIVSINYWLQNKGSYDATNVNIDFFDIPGFEMVELECDENRIAGKSCNLGNIKAGENCVGEMKGFTGVLKAKEAGQATISFSVNYNYHGNSKLSFNIWNKNTIEQWGQKQQKTTYGPVQTHINSDFLMQRMVDGKEETITEWIEEGQRFTLKIDVNDVSTLNTQQSSGKIPASNFKIKFSHVKPEGDCNFTSGFPNQDIQYPTEEPLKCNLKADPVDQEFVLGSVEADYDYNYAFIRQMDFEIQ